MKYTYQTKETLDGSTIIIRSDGACIPVSELNSDYQRYLRWLENPDADETINVLTPTQEPGVVTNGDN